MSEDAELSISELRRKRAQAAGSGDASAPVPASSENLGLQPTVIETTPRPATPARPAAEKRATPRRAPEESEPSFDRSRFIAAIRRRWHWLAFAAVVGGVLAGAVGYVHANYSVLLTLTLRDLSTRFDGQEGVSYKPPKPSAQAMINFLTAPEFLAAVGAKANPPLSGRALSKRLDVNQEKSSENVDVKIIARDPQELVALANLYTESVVVMSREAQMEDPSLMFTNLSRRLAEIEGEQTNLNQELSSLRNQSGITDPVLETPVLAKELLDLQVETDMARGKLAVLDHKGIVPPQNDPLQRRLQDATAQLLVYQSQGKKDEHPDVKRLRDEITEITRQLADPEPASTEAAVVSKQNALAAEKKALESQIAQLESQTTGVKAKLDKFYENTGEYNRIKSALDRLEIYRKTLNDRRFEAQQYRDNAQGYFRPPAAPIALKDIDTQASLVEAGAISLRGGLGGLAVALALVMLLEYFDPRLKTVADVKRITQLPVLATLGDLSKMDETARRAWAFRTWTILSGTLTHSPNRGTVCGFISSAPGEGRSTWVELLVGAARERGFEVTKLDFAHGTKTTTNAANGNPPNASESSAADSAEATTALAVPEKNRALAQAKPASVIHVELPGLVWNLERRQQFQNELEQWQSVARAVILVDLPPASVPESILLAENLPQLIWLVDGSRSQARETKLHLETLRHARCKLVGAVLNHEPEPLISL